MNSDDKKVIEALSKSAEDVEIPSSLEPSAVLSRLEADAHDNAETQDAKSTNQSRTSSHFKVRRRRRMQFAMAACLAIICGVGLLTAGVLKHRYFDDPIAELALQNPIESFSQPSTISSDGLVEVSSVSVAKSYAQLYNRFNTEGAPSSSASYENLDSDVTFESSEDISEIPDIPISGLTDTSKEGGLSSASGDYSQTNVRTEGVDEADIVKTDGKVIYSVQNYGNRLSMVKVDSGKMKKAATIKVKDVVKSNGEFCEFFIDGNKLYLITNVYTDSENAYTYVTTFDVSNPDKPNMLGSAKQTGYYNTARFIDGHLYVFTNFYPEYNAKKSNKKSYVPTIGEEVIACNDIFIPSCTWALDYLVIGTIDSNAPSKIEQTKAVLCGAGNVYVSNDSIYVYGPSRKTFSNRASELDMWEEAGGNTSICKLSYKDGAVDPVAEALVTGEVDDGFSIDEYKGDTRIVTTSYDSKGKTSNNVFILDDELKPVGSLTNIAPGERVYSARLMGDIGYFVTYKQVDPLFSVDLSDPTNPKVIGELKIPGFSEYLHPWGDGRLLGIGQSTSKNGTVTDGIKLSMFDTSDPSNVREIDSFVLKGMYYSDALYDYRAVYANVDRGLVGFFAENAKSFYYLISYDEKDGFSVKLRDQVSQMDYNGTRGVSIGDTFYVATQGFIVSYNMNSFKKISQIKL